LPHTLPKQVYPVIPPHVASRVIGLPDEDGVADGADEVIDLVVLNVEEQSPNAERHPVPQ
jgi:hypothetical protein